VAPVNRPVNDQDDTRPIDCIKCGRSFVSPRWIDWQGPLCPACYDRLHREDEVRRHHVRPPGRGLFGWLRGLLGR
jgi:hypothetical protein